MKLNLSTYRIIETQTLAPQIDLKKELFIRWQQSFFTSVANRLTKQLKAKLNTVCEIYEKVKL